MEDDSNGLDHVIGALREDLKRIESKMDRILSLVDLIPNPLLRKVIKSRITP